MTLTANYLYDGPAAPGSTVCPADVGDNMYKNIRRINATADVSSLLTAGVLCYLTATTNASDMTPTVVDFGDISSEGLMCVVEIVESDPYFPTTTTTAVYPNKITNASATLTDYTHTQNQNIIVIPLSVGMWVWLIGSSNGSFDTTFMTEYEPAANGLIAAIAGAASSTIDKISHKFMSVATTSNQNWALFRYEGKFAHDDA